LISALITADIIFLAATKFDEQFVFVINIEKDNPEPDMICVNSPVTAMCYHGNYLVCGLGDGNLIVLA
jgi:hypothetical protein